ncbi:hypothetical protein [Methylobacterium sp.]|jgi:uncharacterized membrane protein YadS|uniref:hypothetical protein n=1 Tax=Methylobacterium sp. TaxID=409 RepID=UPI002604EFFF|nr:hypothetical protein [Methylobacterium sp.]MDB5644660.1 hypothetical protein [Methylobacterium sp.]
MFALSLTLLLAGIALASVAQSYPKHRAALEWACGTLLIAGLGLLGFGLRLFR